jgi:hypothetical protein
MTEPDREKTNQECDVGQVVVRRPAVRQVRVRLLSGGVEKNEEGLDVVFIC